MLADLPGMFMELPVLDEIANWDGTITVEEGDGFKATMLLDDEEMRRYAAGKFFN